MREHQIVITLKPDQFLEVQRLARAAHAKSMGIFVRQQLLSALGIEGKLGAVEKQVAGPEILPLVDELRRLHADLKTFVAESLVDYVPEGSGAESAADEPSEQAARVDAGSADTGLPMEQEDELERLAGRTFAISPRLGPVEPSGDDLTASSTYSGETPVDGRSDMRHLVSRHQMEPVLRHEIPHNRRDPINFPQESLPCDLGEGSPVRDPLNELLGGSPTGTSSPDSFVDGESGKGWGEEAEDDEFSVPLSLSERRRELAAQESLADSHLDDDIAWPVAPLVSPAPDPAATAQPGPAPSPLPDADPEPEDEAGGASSLPPPEPPPPGNPSGRLPFSGSPPPKRRR